jgi:hypothetical protein
MSQAFRVVFRVLTSRLVRFCPTKVLAAVRTARAVTRHLLIETISKAQLARTEQSNNKVTA